MGIPHSLGVFNDGPTQERCWLLKPDEIISFSEQLIYGSKQSWGKSWTQREIDGFFYNRFLNPSLQAAIEYAQVYLLGGDAPPYPCQWNNPDAEKSFVRPWGKNGSLGGVYQDRFPGGPGPLTAHSKVIPAVARLQQEFCLPEDYLQCTLVHGTPVPFKRFNAYPQYGRPPFFRVIIYGFPFRRAEQDSIKLSYTDFWQWVKRFSDRGRPETINLGAFSVGRNVTSTFYEAGPCRLEVRSDPPYASPSTLVEVLKEAVHGHERNLVGSSVGSASVPPTIRAWTVYLLTEMCGLRNKEAIKLWNDKLGGYLGNPYNLDENSFEPRPGLYLPRGLIVTSSGEAHFSRDKRDLKQRITHYDQPWPETCLRPRRNSHHQNLS